MATWLADVHLTHRSWPMVKIKPRDYKDGLPTHIRTDKRALAALMLCWPECGIDIEVETVCEPWQARHLAMALETQEIIARAVKEPALALLCKNSVHALMQTAEFVEKQRAAKLGASTLPVNDAAQENETEICGEYPAVN